MAKFFFIVFFMLSILVIIFLVYVIGAIIYVADSLAINFDSTILYDARQLLRNFLYIGAEPIFVAILGIMITIVVVGLFSNKLRPYINESLYSLQIKPLTSKNVTVVLPAYNEELVIGQCVNEFVNNKFVNEVIVVDNNSNDNTAKIAKEAGAKVITETKQGYGHACLSGLKESLKTKSDVIVLCEGDGTQNGNDIDKLISYIDNCDMVIGTRTVRMLLEQDTQMSQFYMWGNYFIAFLIELKYFNPVDITYVRLTDAGCTFRAIRRNSLEKIIDKLEPKIHTFALHMILVALENHVTILEVPITFRKRKGISKGAGGKKSLGFKVGLEMIWEIITR